ncbi:MAG: MarR family winged helix-turn-helix transcriptional regulator [Actinomycetota bacterium]|nr:MarR family winged helix-turn-helix transcriptional regulator [Actinomycetota bacterium]
MHDTSQWAARKHAGHRVPLAWVRLLSAHATITRELSARMLATHGLSLTAYEALLFLSWAPEGTLRRSDLAARVLLTGGGITHVLKGLERAGLVHSTPSDTDRRVIYATLTPHGHDRLTRAGADHAADIERLFTTHFTPTELGTLAELLDRLPGTQSP